MILLNPGPVNLSVRVRQAMGEAPDMCHREPEFNDLLQSVRQKLLAVYRLDPEAYSAVVLTGSGTAAVECALSALTGMDGRLLIVSNGVYGERIEKMARACGIEHSTLKLEWGAKVRLDRVEAAFNDGGIAALATVHHETTTGILNDIHGMAEIAKRHGSRVLVDAVSSFAGEAIDFSNLDFVAGTANKCIHGIPGTAFVIVNREALAALPRFPSRTVYLDLRTHFDGEDKGELPFTPGIPSIYVLHAALDELLEEGGERRIADYRTRAAFIRESVRKMGLELFCTEKRMSSCLTSIMLPPGMSYETLHDRLKKEGFVIYAGQSGLRRKLFRVANMGAISMGDLERLVRALKSIMDRTHTCHKR